MLTVEVKISNNNAILHCHGRIVSGDEHTLLCTALQQRGRNVTLDLSGVEAIDAAGIGALVSLQAAGIYLKLMNPTEHVAETLRLTKLDTVFEIGRSPAAMNELLPAGREMGEKGSVRLPAAI
jgi:anti-anti-sigma factor